MKPIRLQALGFSSEQRGSGKSERKRQPHPPVATTPSPRRALGTPGGARRRTCAHFFASPGTSRSCRERVARGTLVTFRLRRACPSAANCRGSISVEVFKKRQPGPESPPGFGSAESSVVVDSTDRSKWKPYWPWLDASRDLSSSRRRGGMTALRVGERSVTAHLSATFRRRRARAFGSSLADLHERRRVGRLNDTARLTQ